MRFSPFLGVLLLTALTMPVAAADPAGDAVVVNPQATGALAGSLPVQLASGDRVFMGQTVVTQNAGEVQIVFSDNTHLVVGPNANLVIAAYLMRNDTTASNVTINALAGTFRFLTGNSPKNAYAINTPTGTMGIRGTAFDFTVMPETGETAVLLYHGAVRMCDQGHCKTLSGHCSVGLMSNDARPSTLAADNEQRGGLLTGFPYLESQSSLESDFQISGAQSCLAMSSEPKSHAPIDTPPPIVAVADVPAPSAPPDQNGPPPPDKPGHDNNGLGNGGDYSGEGPAERDNPGKGKGAGKGNGH